LIEKQYNIWIISGEESGDIYGARLINELKSILPGDRLSISAMGGARIAKTGAEIMVDATELGVVGFLEILGMIGTFIRIFRQLVKRAAKEKPDAVILIDYPGFNLRFAAKLYKLKIPVIWYITPQVWAWKKGRIAKLAKYCSKMMVIFPFETEVYAGTGLDTEFVGHPLVDVIKERTDTEIKRDPNRFLLLPGSRKNEINRLFIPMLETAIKLHKEHPELKFTVSAPRKKVYDSLMKIYNNFCDVRKNEDIPEIQISYGDTGRWMQEAGTGLAASGTVTVECAIAGLPLTVVYKLNSITFFFAKMLVDVPFFTMVNIIAGKLIFEEFLQGDVNANTLTVSIEKILPSGEKRVGIEADINEMTESLSVGSGNASRQAAECVLKTLKIKY
jgi:lipid-A-disaccharide synthase